MGPRELHYLRQEIIYSLKEKHRNLQEVDEIKVGIGRSTEFIMLT